MGSTSKRGGNPSCVKTHKRWRGSSFSPPQAEGMRMHLRPYRPHPPTSASTCACSAASSTCGPCCPSAPEPAPEAASRRALSRNAAPALANAAATAVCVATALTAPASRAMPALRRPDTSRWTEWGAGCSEDGAGFHASTAASAASCASCSSSPPAPPPVPVPAPSCPWPPGAPASPLLLGGPDAAPGVQPAMPGSDAVRGRLPVRRRPAHGGCVVGKVSGWCDVSAWAGPTDRPDSTPSLSCRIQCPSIVSVAPSAAGDHTH